MSGSFRSDPVVVMSATRSGSTLLQRILNVHPDLVVWGEHFGLLTPLFESVRGLEPFSAQLAKGAGFAADLRGADPAVVAGLDNEHINPFDFDGYRSALGAFITSLWSEGLPEGCRWGFKEVRYWSADLTTLLELFPAADIVVLARRPEDQINSMIRAPWRPRFDSTTVDGRRNIHESVARMAGAWHNLYTDLRGFAAAHPDRVTTVRYDELTAEAFPAQRIFGRLGMEPPDPARISAALDQRLGSSDRTTQWLPADREEIDRALASVEWPTDHDELCRYWLDPAHPDHGQDEST